MDAPTPRLSYPEAAWERSVAVPATGDALLSTCLAPWPDLGARPRRTLSGGLRAWNLLLGDDVVARLALAPDHDLVKERALLDAMHGVVRVPRVLDGDARILLLEHVPHEELPATEEVGEAVGRAAAAIHARRFPTWGFLDAALARSTPTPRALDALRAHAEDALRAGAGPRLGALADGVRAALDAEAAALDASCSPAVLVHADFKPANLKWVPAERAVLVLDWEFAWAGPALFDVGQLFRWDVAAPFERGFVRAYRGAGGGLPSEWRRVADAWDLVNLVGLLAAPGDHPIRDRDCVRRVRRTLDGR